MDKIGYSVDEAVQASGIGRTSLYELLQAGEIDSIKVGRRRIIPADALQEFFDRRRGTTDQELAAS